MNVTFRLLTCNVIAEPPGLARPFVYAVLAGFCHCSAYNTYDAADVYSSHAAFADTEIYKGVSCASSRVAAGFSGWRLTSRLVGRTVETEDSSVLDHARLPSGPNLRSRIIYIVITRR